MNIWDNMIKIKNNLNYVEDIIFSKYCEYTNDFEYIDLIQSVSMLHSSLQQAFNIIKKEILDKEEKL